MTETMNRDRRSAVLAAMIGSVLAGYAGSAVALDWEMDNGATINWNTTLSAGANWRAEDPSRRLYTRADGSLIGLYSSPLNPGTAVGSNDGLAGNHAAGDGNLNFDKGDRFSTPFKLISDIEVKKGRFGGLLRVKAWYDYTLVDEKVRVGSQANNYNGVRPGLGPVANTLCATGETWTATAPCFPMSQPGQNLWPEAELSDRGFETEQQFSNAMLLDAYLYGSFEFRGTDMQLRLGKQVINWGESIFIQGVNQINPIDVPAARRAGAELKEILLPVWAAYINWGFDWGSIEAFYQLEWDNTSVDACGTYFTATSTLIGADPASCGSITVVGGQLGNLASGTTTPIVPQFGSQPYLQANGTYVPAADGREAKDSGQAGIAIRFPVAALDTEIGLYAMNIHSRLPYSSGMTGTNPNDVPQIAGLQCATSASTGCIWGNDAYGPYWKATGSSTLYRSLMPILEKGYEALLQGAVDLESGKGFWEYPEDMHIFGVSAATNLFSWSVSAEASYQQGIPAQVNGNDLIGASVLGIGPYRAETSKVSKGHVNTYLKGFETFDKRQLQLNAVKTYSNVFGAENFLFVGEVGAQWNGVPDYTEGGVRYGRGFMYGSGSGQGYSSGGAPSGQPTLGAASQGNLCSPTFVGAPVPVHNTLYNPHPDGCRNDGYITDFAWGYRLRVSADYNNVFNSGVTVTPSVYWADDVEGVSIDPAFNEDRQTLGLGVKFNLNKRYQFDVNYVTYANDTFDPSFDRDYYSAAVSMTF